jgi:spore maturation protein CgeB
VQWPDNVQYIHHLPPAEHRQFYNRQRFTQNITRDDMVKAGYSPSVRLFEAAACGTPIISDYWEGLNTFFIFDTEILISRTADDTLHYLQDLSENDRKAIGDGARQKVLAYHTAAHRAIEVECYVRECHASYKISN